MQYWNWGIPITIPKPPSASPQPQSWNQLRFNQISLFDLHHHIGIFASEPGVYNDHHTQFDATDLTWFATGLSTEVLHLTQNAFPPKFSTLQHATPSGQVGSHVRSTLCTHVQKLTFDLAALWDHAFGGATLIIHVEGTTHSNAPRQPEYIKSDVYFPGYLIEEDPQLSPIISKLVQKYIIDVGMPVIEQWERCTRVVPTTFIINSGHLPAQFFVSCPVIYDMRCLGK